MSTTRRWRRLGTITAVAVTMLVLSACGGKGDDDGVASAGGDQNAGNPAEDVQNPPAPQDPDEQALRFAACMRDNGVDMPDPGPGQQGLVEAFQSVSGNYDQATLDTAVAACQSLLPQYEAEGPQHGSEEWQLAVAECLREQGLDVSDNLFDDLHSGELDQEQLAIAMEACRDVINGGAQ